MAKRRTNPIEELRETIREGLEAAVNVIGFAGVLDLLADARAEIILNAIESAIEEITEIETDDEEEDEEEETDGDEEDDENTGEEGD